MLLILIFKMIVLNYKNKIMEEIMSAINVLSQEENLYMLLINL